MFENVEAEVLRIAYEGSSKPLAMGTVGEMKNDSDI
jgi:hypothetical protein